MLCCQSQWDSHAKHFPMETWDVQLGVLFTVGFVSMKLQTWMGAHTKPRKVSHKATAKLVLNQTVGEKHFEPLLCLFWNSAQHQEGTERGISKPPIEVITIPSHTGAVKHVEHIPVAFRLYLSDQNDNHSLHPTDHVWCPQHGRQKDWDPWAGISTMFNPFPCRYRQHQQQAYSSLVHNFRQTGNSQMEENSCL